MNVNRQPAGRAQVVAALSADRAPDLPPLLRGSALSALSARPASGAPA